MKILQINSHYNQGGAARIVACIHRQLLREGVESYVAYGRGQQSQEQNVYRFNHTLGIYASALFSRVTGLNGWSNRHATKRLIRFIDKIHPDIIHMHALHGYYLNFPMLFDYINEKKYPCVWTFHDCHAFVGNCGYFFDCNKWQKGCNKCPYLRNYPISLLFDHTKYMWEKKRDMFTCGENKIIVSPSDWLTSEAKKSFFGKYPCITIHNGIDIRTFYPRDKKICREKHGFKQNEKVVLGIAVGYDDPRKGAKYILETARALSNEAKFVLVGWEEKNNKMLEGITNVVTFPATSNLEILAEYYSLADVFVLPSLAENYATVSLESMACGTPVVGFDVGGIPEQLIDGKGLVVPVGNQKMFTEAVRKVIFGEGNIITGNKLSDLVSYENNVEKMTESYMELYKMLLI